MRVQKQDISSKWKVSGLREEKCSTNVSYFPVGSYNSVFVIRHVRFTIMLTICTREKTNLYHVIRYIMTCRGIALKDEAFLRLTFLRETISVDVPRFITKEAGYISCIICFIFSCYRGDILILIPFCGLRINSRSSGTSSLLSRDSSRSLLSTELSTTFSSSIANLCPVKSISELYRTF
jgi:hypothetical protein